LFLVTYPQDAADYSLLPRTVQWRTLCLAHLLGDDWPSLSLRGVGRVSKAAPADCTPARPTDVAGRGERVVSGVWEREPVMHRGLVTRL